MKKTVLIFTLLIIAVATLLRISDYSLIKGNISTEIVIACVAGLFLLLGLYFRRNKRPELIQIDKATAEKAISELGISQREYEILREVASGLSNKEIADKLFVSESTVKTHVSNLFVKLDVKRRTQAVQKAKSIGIL